MSSKDKKRLVLLDSHAIIHRAYHALPDFSSAKGEPTGALYGLVTMLIKIFGELSPDYVVACYDVPEPTHRHDVYDGYKATRKKIDDALIAQLIRSKDVFTAFGIPIYEKAGFEADDMLGTIVEKLKDNENIEVVIASGDMDTLQLVSGTKVRAYTLRKGIQDTVLYDEALVQERFGFGPELLPDYKGLRGDPSDNIIGVPGIGEKTGSELIQKFGSIENIYKKIKSDKNESGESLLGGAIKSRTVELLKSHEEEAKFSKMLATIRRDAPIDFVLPEKSWREAVVLDKVKALFSELEFRTLFDRVQGAVQGKSTAKADVKNTTQNEDIKKDETSTKEKKTKRKAAGTGDTAQLALVADLPNGVTQAEVDEVALALWVVDSNISNPGIAEILNYGNTDSFAEAREKIFAKLNEGRTQEVFENIEKPLTPVIRKMEARGVKVDTEYLKKLSAEYHKTLDGLQKKIWELAGEEFNVNSPKQLGEILFGKLLAQKKGKTTATGNRSTKESELEKVRDEHPIVPLLLDYRELQKLLSTYIDTIPEKVAADGRLHARFNQTGAVTGRLSSTDPNLQNIPIKSELGQRIRNAFVAERGNILVGFDYSQIELRVAAFLSGDEKLVEIFKLGGDIHAGVASEVFKVPVEKVDAEMRRRAKVINFGILYGMGVNALRTNLGTDTAEAKRFHEEYFKNFQTLANYLETTKSEAAKNGYTETFFGRRRHFPGIRSKLPFIKAMNERMAINAPIQGTSADMIKLAMIQVNKMIEQEKLDDEVSLILTVHDELVFEVKENAVEKIRPKIEHIMQSILSLDDTRGVPIIVSSEVGKNWGEME